jgi:hypothetical protein
MSTKSFLKTAVFLALLAGVSTGAFAQLTISGGFALSTMDAKKSGGEVKLEGVEGGIGIGGNVYFDYLLPIGIPLSLGAEIGIDTAALNFKYGSSKQTDNVMAVPLLLRAAYHFDLDPKLDLFLVGKVGYAVGAIVSGPDKDYLESAGGFGFGIDIGVAYYFTSVFGLFAEAGFDGYMIESKFKATYNKETINFTVDTPFYRFATIGLSFRK